MYRYSIERLVVLSIGNEHCMPEGPEVELAARKVSLFLSHAVLTKIELISGPYVTNPKPKYSRFREKVGGFEPHTVQRVYANGKQMIFELQGPQYAVMTSHFGMSGQWCWTPEEYHLLTLHVSLHGESRELYFCDQRRFGTFSLLTAKELDKKLSGLGLQILSVFTISEFLHQLHKHPEMTVCDVLLEQSIFAGIGNYLRADIMYVAGIDPLRLVSSLTKFEERNLCRAVRDVCQESLAAEATTCEKYETTVHTGAYVFKIYGKDTDDQGNAVIKFGRKNRTVHWCPAKQH
jgi:DNA-formamidopyrimidine glycosylase